MQNLTFLKRIPQVHQGLAAAKPELQLRRERNSGYTLIEVLVVVIMIAILAAIAAPGWLSFVSRQRVSKANDAVLQALQQAQRDAKKNKLNYNVSFISDPGKVPQIAIYPGNTIPIPTADSRWKDVGDISIKPGQISLSTNIVKNTTNQVDSTNSFSQPSSSGPVTITFDYMGSLPNAKFGIQPAGQNLPGLKVVLADNAVKRCVIVETLIGGMRTARDQNCN